MERLTENPTAQLQAKLHRLTVGKYVQARAKGNVEVAAAFASGQNWVNRGEIALALKAAVSDLDLADLPPTVRPISEAFLHALRPLTIAGRLEGLQSVPLRTRVFANTAGLTAAMVLEHGRIPVLRSDWTVTELESRKFAGITVVTEELLHASSPAAQAAIAADLVAAVAAAEDLAFVAPSAPGSILDGAPSVASTGSTLATIDADLRALVALVPGAGHPNTVFTMSKTTATFLATVRGTGGAAAYPDLGPQGGKLLEVPVFTSAASEGVIGLLNPGEILWNEGDAVVTTSTAAALVMSDNAADVSNPVSMFQSAAVSIKALRMAGWYARPGAAAYISGVTY